MVDPEKGKSVSGRPQIEEALREGVPKVKTSEINGAAVVRTEKQLLSAMKSESRVKLGDNILASSNNINISSSDFDLDLNGYTIKRSDGTNERFLEITSKGNMTIRNGTIDLNRTGQDFPSSKEKGIIVHGGGKLRMESVTTLEQSNFAFEARGWDSVYISNYNNDVRPSTIEDDHLLSGLDGIHLYDCKRVTFSDPIIKSGDDCIAISAKEVTCGHVTIEGGSLSSPRYANGIRIHTHTNADPNTTLEEIVIDTRINNCGKSGIILTDDGETGNQFGVLEVGGTITNVGTDAILSTAPVSDVMISATIRNTENQGVNLAGGGENVTFNGTITDVNLNGINIRNYNNVCIGGSLDGENNGEKAIVLEDVTNASITASIHRWTQNGIYGLDSYSVSISGSTISAINGLPIESRGTSDSWTIVGNTGLKNSNRGTNLSGTQNIVENNNL